MILAVDCRADHQVSVVTDEGDEFVSKLRVAELSDQAPARSD